MKSFNEIKIKDFNIDPFELKMGWVLVTAEKDGKVNTMTASWGGFGVMWDKDVAFVVVRPDRYTKEFIDASELFSLTFFSSVYKKQLGYLGRISGRYENKIEEAELTVLFEDKIPYFKEAEKVLIVKKLYKQSLEENCFIDKSIIEKWYPEGDCHILYIAEITKILVK
ncbi:MAG: hypothetical protein RL662_1696 [Bacteroidota bacterium]|jgi:flavin reductase (DIM6/NTAB) family NADH-FMN oxidoreductase RutF